MHTGQNTRRDPSCTSPQLARTPDVSCCQQNHWQGQLADVDKLANSSQPWLQSCKPSQHLTGAPHECVESCLTKSADAPLDVTTTLMGSPFTPWHIQPTHFETATAHSSAICMARDSKHTIKQPTCLHLSKIPAAQAMESPTQPNCTPSTHYISESHNRVAYRRVRNARTQAMATCQPRRLGMSPSDTTATTT